MISIRPIRGADEESCCAGMMAGSDPWVTLGRGFEQCLAAVRNREREVWVAAEGDAVRGLIILSLRGALAGYIQAICVGAAWRGSGLGTRLLDWAEERLFRCSPNVFLCVSSFNGRARALYERRGYELVGDLRDYLVIGHSEMLMRKTVGPIQDFKPTGDC
jgi:ribosomal protein S18 acetylase RimI-like enzyme